MLQHDSTMKCLVKSLFEDKTMNKLESVNAHLVVHLLFMTFNVIFFGLKIATMSLEIQMFNAKT